MEWEDGVRPYYRHCRANLKHNSHCPFVADQQSIGDSSVFAGVKAEQFVLSGGVPSAALQGQSRASAPLPEPHATCAPLEMRRFPVVRWPSPLCVPGAPVCPPTNRENLLPQFSIRFVSNSHRQVPISPIRAIVENCLPAVAPAHHMVARSSVLNAQRSCHRCDLYRNVAIVSIVSSDPFFLTALSLGTAQAPNQSLRQ
jgi:hypothetical protein